MKHLLRAAGLLLLLTAALCIPARAAEFSDLEGHWAQPALETAAERGYLTGFPDGTMRPNAAINGAQAVSLLTRMLDARSGAPLGDAWYAGAAGQAAALGIIDPAAELSAPLARRQAFSMLAEAFQLCAAAEDAAALDAFSDVSSLGEDERAACAALLRRNIVQGYADGTLRPDESLTRAEFAALLDRLLSQGEIVSAGAVADWSGDILWVGCGAGNVRLSRVTADTVVIRTQGLGSVRLSGCAIGTLVLAHDGELSLQPEGVETLCIGPGGGAVTVRDSVKNVEITGDGRAVTISANVDSLLLAGDGVAVRLNARAAETVLSGRGDTLTVGGSADQVRIDGPEARLEGGRSIGRVILRAPDASVPKRVREIVDEIDYGLLHAELGLELPERLPAGTTLTAAAEVWTSAPLDCVMTWLMDGEIVESRPVTLTGNDRFTLTHDYTYTRDMARESSITCRLDYTTRYGEAQFVAAQRAVALENYDQAHYDALDRDRVLALVTDTYAGDYTLAWAESHDYTAADKELWVNVRGFESDSPYLIWVNHTYQRVNIFEGSRGQWRLSRSSIVATGADWSPTPGGVFKTTYKQPGWYTAGYDVYPVVRFYGGGYAFHSRLYWPGTHILQDGAIGYPVSHGCVRMYDEDIQWIYNNVPDGTTVVSY